MVVKKNPVRKTWNKPYRDLSAAPKESRSFGELMKGYRNLDFVSTGPLGWNLDHKIWGPMIQIIAYRSFTDRLSNKQKTTDKLTEVRAPSVRELFADLPRFLNQLEERELYDLHYTLAECYESKRLFRKQKTWVIDIDGDVDLKRLDEYWAVVAKCTNLDMSVFGIVKSGGGLHFIWEATTYFAESVDRLGEIRKNYIELCRSVETEMAACGLPGGVDNQVIRKSGTLRLPGTMNTKYDPPRMAELHKADIIPVEFDIESLHPVEPTRAVISKDEARKYSTPHKEFIKEKCAFIADAYAHPEKQSEPAWFAALTIVSRFSGGSSEAHTMSKGHPGYNYDDTEAKISHAFENSGPYTCEKIAEICDKCETCPFNGKITSPITLQGNDFIATKETGFWFWSTKDGISKPTKPDYEGLRRFFEFTHSYIVLESEEVYVWRKNHWEKVPETWIRGFVQEHLDPKPSSGHVSEFLSLIKRTNLTKTSWVNDSVARKLNLKNGVLDLESMQLLPHSMEYFFTGVLPYGFDSDATSPRFDQFMDEVTQGNLEMKLTLLEFLGYAFSGMEYKYHKVLILPGDGSNGKSTFLNVIKALAGKNYSSLLVNQLEDEKLRCNLVGKLFNVAEETPRKGLLDSSHFKILTSGGEYSARAVYSVALQIENNRTKFMMACNELPSLNDFSHGMIRRLLICPFDAVFTEGINADTNLEAKLRAELPGILNRVIQGYERLLKANRFTLAQKSIDAVNEYRESTDTVQMWSQETVVTTMKEHDFASTADLYMSYKNYCMKLGVFTVSLQKFSKDFTRISGQKSYVKRLNDNIVRGYDGVKVRDQVGF